jgi:orotidine-5'-phosphate decarboxylase
MSVESPIILAVDTTDLSKVRVLIEETRPFISIYKFGLEFYLRHGLYVLREIKDELDLRIFLDLKLHDIPNTVGKAASSVAELDPFILTVHASGGSAMIKSASAALPSTIVAAVTILTSLDQAALDEMGFSAPLSDLVTSLAKNGEAGGARALVASPHEISQLRALFPTMKIITPGIRLENGGDDQRRTMNPREAITLGSDYLVIGRPITSAQSPGKAAQSILHSLG